MKTVIIEIMAKIKLEIKNRWTGNVLFTYESDNNNFKKTVLKALDEGANLRCANLRRADLVGANLRDADLIGANLRDADLIGANLRDANLIGADLRGANLRDANLVGANLRDADLVGANLRCANLRDANLRDADLIGANLRDANLRDADLRGANLRDADLVGANLRDADLVGANLRCANLVGANLIGAKYGELEIQNLAVFDGLYKYRTFAIIDKDGNGWVRLGCHFRSVGDWEKDFWNNDSEFPNDGELRSRKRVFAYETAKRWIELNKE
jgi:uncharacterized protein YjbI with pentapeptide repeats